MQIRNKYPVKTKATTQKSTSTGSGLSLVHKTEPRPNIRKKSADAPLVQHRQELSINPQSPLLAPQESVSDNFLPTFSVAASNTLPTIDELRVLRIERTSPLQDEGEQITELTVEESASHDSNEKLNALKQSLFETEEARKNSHLLIEENTTDNSHGSRQNSRQNSNHRGHSSQQASSAWQWSLTLRPSFVITGLFVMCITLGFFFTFGIIVGRGISPAPEPLELTSIVPSESENEAVDISEILTAEELAYSTELRASDDEIIVEQPNILSSPNQNSVVPYPIGGQQSVSQSTNQQASTSEFTIYQYELRVASLRTLEDAEALVERLEQSNLRAEVSRSTSWYLVNINYLGTEAAFDEMRESLTRFGINDSIITSKEVLELG